MLNWCKKLSAFFCGVFEFKNSFTKSYEDIGLDFAYEHGRNFAHKLTFNRYEENENA
jgi:hypothetical protein